MGQANNGHLRAIENRFYLKRKPLNYSTLHYPMFITVIIALLLWTPLLLIPAHAASSANVSLERDLYHDMEFWAAEGLIGSNLYSIKPFAGSEVGNQLVAALDKCYAMKTPSASCRRIQDYYTKLFDGEISEAKSASKINNTFLKPVESFSISYTYFSDYPSVFNNEGLLYGKGSNALLQLQSQARLFRFFSFFVQPVVFYNQHFGNDEDGSNTDIRLHKGYAKLTIYNVELQVGRDSLWWGPGYHGSLLMSNNAKPFDMIKLSNPEPVLLPWIFSYLGPVQFNLIFSQLNDERTGRELANPFLYGLRLGLKPLPFLEIGGSHLALFGGPGRRDMSLGDIFKTLYSNSNREYTKTDSNQEVAVDFALTVPHLKKYLFLVDGIKLYGEAGAEDTGFPPDRRAFIFGLAFFKPFTLEGTVLRSEYAMISPGSKPGAWYRHSWYPMRYEGRVFGHHAGTDSDDIFIEWSQSFEKFIYKLGFDRERSGIDTKTYPQLKNQYFGEIGYRINPHTNITLRYAYEDVKNLDNIQDQNEKNHFLQVEAALYF